MRRGLGPWAVAAALALGAASAWGEAAWVQGAPLNLRSGAGTQFRILATVKPGERVEVVTRGDGWTQVRTGEGKQGWIAAGYLAPEAPPRARLAQLERETSELTERLEATTREAQRLEGEYETVSGRDAEQRSELERLTRENMRLQAGERWAEWLTGALILGLGMVAGAILRGLSARRRSSRLKL